MLGEGEGLGDWVLRFEEGAFVGMFVSAVVGAAFMDRGVVLAAGFMGFDVAMGVSVSLINDSWE